MRVLPVLLADFYKTSHRVQYPEGTEYVFSNWIPRKSRIDGIDKVVSFGIQKFVIKYLIQYFNDNFFNVPIDEIVDEYKRFMSSTLGPGFTDSTHIEDLYFLGYLPLEIKAIPEGERVPIGVPMLTIINTDPKFFWLTNYIETLISCEIWSPMTSATIAYTYREMLDAFAMETVGNIGFTQFQGHDFSMRGMSSIESAVNSGMGHLLSFVGTDTIPAIYGLEEFYGADVTKELVGCSVPATEHSVQCANGVGSVDEETAFVIRLLTELYPTGIVSMVSDTINLWDVVTKILPAVKDIVMARDGKFVVRPDSGDPVKILCGDPEAEGPARKGLIELLWDIFGGMVNSMGYKELDPHIGAIYGDSITLDRAFNICQQLKDKGFASTNVVLGIGSYTYQYNTRDTFGFAMKSTYAVVNGQERLLWKDPVTDSGVKKSLKGLCVVLKNETSGEYYVLDKMNMEQYNSLTDLDEMNIIFRDGSLFNRTTLNGIRSRLLV